GIVASDPGLRSHGRTGLSVVARSPRRDAAPVRLGRGGSDGLRASAHRPAAVPGTSPTRPQGLETSTTSHQPVPRTLTANTPEPTRVVMERVPVLRLSSSSERTRGSYRAFPLSPSGPK